MINDNYREEITSFVQSIPGFQGCNEEDVETLLACDAEGCGFQMLNDDEIVTSVEEESEPISTGGAIKIMIENCVASSESRRTTALQATLCAVWANAHAQCSNVHKVIFKRRTKSALQLSSVVSYRVSKMEVNNEKIPYMLVFFFDKGESPSQVVEIVSGVYGADTVIANYVKFWFGRFRSGILLLKMHLAQAGTVDKITEIIEVDQHVKIVASPRS
ncbi:uncharacterized protein TNCV_3087481 [Trichonephila clavipes]|uniref:Mos1 transposase HTH domain-containing protein n=1 Tax=Trichonephila clavipes TaxID=2585209 RepID=A0A8X6RL05_TRICX|nr:uncharacterized protein TNCV_3087481 [Trichonephila clavipes]